MKYLVISEFVIVIGPPLFICSLNNGTTEPEESRTFPNLTIEKRILSLMNLLLLFKLLSKCLKD